MPSTRHQLLYQFLQLLGIPVNAGLSSNHPTFQDPFMHTIACEVRGNSFWPQPVTLPQIGLHASSTEPVKDSFTTSAHVYPTTIRAGGGRTWFSNFDATDAVAVEQLGLGLREFTRYIFSCFVQVSPALNLSVPSKLLLHGIPSEMDSNRLATYLSFESGISLKR